MSQNFQDKYRTDDAPRAPVSYALLLPAMPLSALYQPHESVPVVPIECPPICCLSLAGSMVGRGRRVILL
jgi:hypothetical protein